VTLQNAFKIIRSRWILVAVITGLATIAAVAYAWLTPPEYTASTDIFIATPDIKSAEEAYAGSRFSQGRAVSYADLIESEALASRTAARLHLSVSPRELASKVHASANPESVLLILSVTDTSVVGAEKVANAMADDFVRLVADLETPEDGGPPAARAVVVQRALGAQWVSPNRPRIVAFGVVSGLLLGCAVALLMRRPDEFESHALPPISVESDTASSVVDDAPDGTDRIR
jgi:capsular polysaccharide biosynthesis protein